MTNLTKIFVFCSLVFSFFTKLNAQCPGQYESTVLLFDFNDCASNIGNGTNQDYSEFTSESSNPNSCSNPELLGGHLYRFLPQKFTHSCTPGVDGTPAMCVSAVRDCDFIHNSNYEVRFDLNVTPEPGEFITINSLSFYEASPEIFSWLGGTSGENDYPTLYSVRIYANNVEVFHSKANETSSEYSLENFDFSGYSSFMVNSPTIFSFELVAYCPVGNGGPVSLWDLDDLSISTSCSYQGSVDGGSLEGGPFEFCVGDDTEDYISIGDLSLSANVGSNSMYLLTDILGTILAIASDYSTLNFNEFNTGNCMLWHLAYEDNFGGATVGSNLSQMMGCFSLSNSIQITKLNCGNGCEANGGILNSQDYWLCVDDGLADIITESDLNLVGNIGSSNQWLITDLQGSISELPNSISDIDFEGSEIGECLVWNISYEDSLIGLMIGNNVSQLMGCFSLSNPIQVSKEECEEDCMADGGMLSGGPFEFCVDDGINDFLLDSQLVLSGNQGTNSQWIVADALGNIIGLPSTFTEVNFEGVELGLCLILHLSYESGLVGLSPGANINQLVGCYDLSNSIEVIRVSCENPCFVEGGNLAGGPFEYCIDDGDIDFIKDGQIVQWGASGQHSQWVLTDANGNILELPGYYTEFNFDIYPEGICYIWFMTFESGLVGLDVDSNINSLDGCFDFSQAVEVIKTDCTTECMPVGGLLLGGPFTFCQNDNDPDDINASQIILENNEGPLDQWVIIDENEVIVAIPNDLFAFDFMSLGLGDFQLVNVSYEAGLIGLLIGNSINNLEGCWGVSNPIAIYNNDCLVPCNVVGSNLSSPSFEFCVGDGTPDLIGENQIVSSGGSGAMSTWIITDTNGQILSLPANYWDVDFDNSPVGTCLIWELLFDPGLQGAVIGSNINNLVGCFALSNSIEVLRVDCSNPIDDCPLQVVNSLFGIIDNNLVVLDLEVATIKEIIPLTGGFSSEYAGFTYHQAEGIYYAISDPLNEPQLVSIDVHSGMVTLVGVLTQSSQFINTITIAEALEYNSDDGQLYVSLGDNSDDPDNNFFTRHLFTLNTTTAEASYVASLNGSCQSETDGMVYLDGTMYFTDGCPSPINWGSLDVESGQQTIITNLSAVEASSRLASDESTGTIYYFDAVNRTLYSIDEAGELTPIGESYAEGVFNELLDEIAFGPRISENSFGGIILGGQFVFCIADDQADYFEEGELQLYSEYGNNFQWIVTNDENEILMLPDHYTNVDFGGLVPDICYVWHLSYDSVVGLDVGENLNNLEGCFDLSNPIIVEKVIDGPACLGIIEDAEISNDFKIATNPVNELLELNSINLKDGVGVIRLIDTQGKILHEEIILSDATIIDVGNLPIGLYFINLYSGQDLVSKRMVKIE